MPLHRLLLAALFVALVVAGVYWAGPIEEGAFPPPDETAVTGSSRGGPEEPGDAPDPGRFQAGSAERGGKAGAPFGGLASPFGSPDPVRSPRATGAGAEGEMGAFESRSEPAAAPTDEERPSEPGTGRLLITILDAMGAPVVGVPVDLRYEASSTKAETDGRGEVLFADLKPGPYSVGVEPPGRPSLMAPGPVRLEEGEERQIVLRMGREDLAIRGRVLDDRGAPIAGAEVSSRYLFQVGDDRLIPPGPRIRRTLSGSDGFFEIGGLSEGEYSVAAAAPDGGGDASAVVPAGSAGVDLVIGGTREVSIHGTVTSVFGGAVEGARVVVLGQSAGEQVTDPQGRYDVRWNDPRSRAVPTIGFIADGYETRYVTPELHEIEGVPSVRVDVQLEPEGEKLAVTGLVRASDGEPVVGQAVRLYSPQTRTQQVGLTDQDGYFTIANVRSGRGYRLTVQSGGAYADYLREPIDVERDTVFLEIVLERLARGRITGMTLDPDGQLLPDFPLWLRNVQNPSWSQRFVSDARGYFALEDVPAGDLVFETRSHPHLRVRGMWLGEGESLDVALPLDSGSYELGGRVVDAFGSPVGGAALNLSWSRTDAGTVSTSIRTGFTDGRGLFRFSGLGRGPHLLDVRAPGYERLRRVYAVDGSAVDVQVLVQPSSG